MNTKTLRDGVTINGMLAHERAFQFIANANGGTRASGTPGFDASADYVQPTLTLIDRGPLPPPRARAGRP